MLQENLGIVRKDEVSQGQCLNPHVDLALSVSRLSPLATSVEVSAWNGKQVPIDPVILLCSSRQNSF